MSMSPEKARRLERERKNREAMIQGIGMTLRELKAEILAEQQTALNALREQVIALQNRVAELERVQT